jgi:hypothetical protein
MVLRCTRKLVTAGRLALTEPAPAPDADDLYLNVLSIHRRRWLLVVHAGTLFPTLVPGVRKPHFDRLGDVVGEALVQALVDLELAASTFGRLDPRQAVIAPTASRQVLGFMNDMAQTVDWVVRQSGGPDRVDLVDLQRLLARTPYNRGGFLRPVDAAAGWRQRRA